MHAGTVTEAWHGELMIMILPGDRGARAGWIPGAGDFRARQLPGS